MPRLNVKVQAVWSGQKRGFRLLISGGLIIYTDKQWGSRVASMCLDRLEAEGFNRKDIRFIEG